MKIALVIFVCLPMWAQERVGPSESHQHQFPTKDRIELLLNQSERAFDTYELAIGQENQAGGKIAQAVSKDREVLDRARDLIARLKRAPDGFNGPAGFLLVGNLDDASRNMSVCMGQAGMDSGFQTVDRNLPIAQGRLHLAQTCLDASNLLYTVSETAFDMYSEFLLAQEGMTQRAMSALEKCVSTLKENLKDKGRKQP